MSRHETATTVAIAVEMMVVEGTAAGRRFVMQQFPAVVGRSAEADVRLEDQASHPTISRRHVSIELSHGKLTLTDRSSNGTWLAGRRLNAGETVPLPCHGEPVWLGPHTRVAFRLIEPEPPSPGSAIDLRALGPLQLMVNGVAVPDEAWGARQAKLVLAFLCEQGNRAVEAAQLLETLWADSSRRCGPDSSEASRQAVQTAISRIRRVLRKAGLEVDPIRCDHAGYTLDGVSVHYDVTAFEQACDEVARAAGNLDEALERAMRLYHGRFLTGHNDDWTLRRRQALQGRFNHVAVLAGERHRERGMADRAIECYRRVLDEDACHEAAQLGMLRALLEAGRHSEAVMHYRACVRSTRALGVPLSAELVRAYEESRLS
jgi:DNA-binding SARP family transcriptional activator